MYYFARAIDENGQEILGSGGALIIRNIITIKGAVNRIRKAVWPKNTSCVMLYFLQDENKRYDNSAYRKIGQVQRVQRTNI